MEDYLHAALVRDAKSSEQIGCFGVFDGHGGPDAAAFVREHLFNNITAHDKFHSDVRVALQEAFLATDREYLASDVSVHCGPFRALTRMSHASFRGDSAASPSLWGLQA